MAAHYWITIDPDEIEGAPPVAPGAAPGHARSKHGVTKEQQAAIMNTPDRVFTGINKQGREVDVYYQAGSVVITVAGKKNQVITAYGKISSKGSAGPLSPEQFSSDPLFKEVKR